MKAKIEKIIKESINAKEELIKTQIDTIAKIVEKIVSAVKNKKKVFVFGNGGSAADSQHIVAEFMGRFKKERRPIPAIALTTNTSTVTAISNDYGYQLTFARQVEGLGSSGDIAIGISTSGNAQNVIEALKSAKAMGLGTIALTGKDGGSIAKLADIAFMAPTDNTPRIQELHITVGHIICELVEDQLN